MHFNVSEIEHRLSWCAFSNTNKVLNCLEHKSFKYIFFTHDKRVQLTNNQYVTYAPLSLAGSIVRQVVNI